MPYANNEHKLLSEAAQSATAPHEVLAAAGPNLPQWIRFPSRFGYKQKQPGIMDVMNANRGYPAVTNFSGRDSSYSGTSTNSLGTV